MFSHQYAQLEPVASSRGVEPRDLCTVELAGKLSPVSSTRWVLLPPGFALDRGFMTPSSRSKLSITE